MNSCFSFTCTFNFFLFIYASGSSSGARIRMWVPSIKPMTPGNPPSSSKLVRMASLSFTVKLNFKTIVKVISGKFIFHLFCTVTNSPLGHGMNWPERWIAACDSRFRTRSTLLIVMSNLSATARAGSWLAILQRKAKTCFEGGMAARPEPFSSGIIPVGMTARVNSSHVRLVILKWFLNSSGK